MFSYTAPDRPRERPPHPSPRSEGCSTIVEEREVSWSQQHPSRPIQADEEYVITALTTICNKIWQTGEWPTPWIQSLVITLPKKGNQNYGTISLIGQTGKIMLKVILNRLKPQAEKIIAEGTGRLQSRKEYHRADLQPTHSL